MADAPLRVTVSASLRPGQVQEWVLRLPAGATVAQALAGAGLQPADLANLALGVWGRSVGPHDLLRDGDRLECCRALTVDPKIARRQRFASQGARGTGLFARRRPGAKQGY